MSNQNEIKCEVCKGKMDGLDKESNDCYCDYCTDCGERLTDEDNKEMDGQMICNDCYDEDRCEKCKRSEGDCENAGLEFDTGCLSTYLGHTLCPDCIPCGDCEELGEPCDNCCEDV